MPDVKPDSTETESLLSNRPKPVTLGLWIDCLPGTARTCWDSSS